MRVLFVSDFPHLPGTKGGLQTTTHDLCLAMGVMGAEAAVLCGLPSTNTSTPSDDNNSTDNTAKASLSDEALGYLCMRSSAPAAALPLVATAWNASVIVVQSGTSLSRMVLASLDTGRPTAVYLHNVEEHRLGGALIPDPSLLYLANSAFCAERWQALFGLNCHVIEPVVNAESYITQADIQADITTAGVTTSGITSSGGNKILFVNPIAIKGVELVLALAAHCPDLPFLVVESWGLEPHWRAYCQQRASALGNIEWLGPQVDMRPVYAQARVLLMPSVWEEAFGRTVIEAQLNGIPVLASDRGALRDTVGEGGLTFSPHAPIADWADGLRDLLHRHDSYGAAARHRAQNFTTQSQLRVADMLGLLAEHSFR